MSSRKRHVEMANIEVLGARGRATSFANLTLKAIGTRPSASKQNHSVPERAQRSEVRVDFGYWSGHLEHKSHVLPVSGWLAQFPIPDLA